MARPLIPVDPRGHLPTAGKANRRRATEVEASFRSARVIPFFLIERGEKPGSEKPVHFTVDCPLLENRTGVVAQIEEPTRDGALPQELASAGDPVVKRIPAHQGAVREEEVRGRAHWLARRIRARASSRSGSLRLSAHALLRSEGSEEMPMISVSSLSNFAFSSRNQENSATHPGVKAMT